MNHQTSVTLVVEIGVQEVLQEANRPQDGKEVPRRVTLVVVVQVGHCPTGGRDVLQVLRDHALVMKIHGATTQITSWVLAPREEPFGSIKDPTTKESHKIFVIAQQRQR